MRSCPLEGSKWSRDGAWTCTLKNPTKSVTLEARWIGCLTSQLTIFQSYVTAHRCAGRLKKKLDQRWGSQRNRHFEGFFNVSVEAPTRDQPFYTVISPVRARGYVENVSSVSPACRKRRLIGAVCRNHRLKKGWSRVGARTGTFKNPTKCLWRWEPDRTSNFFSPPAHLCAVTYYWNIVNCDVKQPIQLNSIYTVIPRNRPI